MHHTLKFYGKNRQLTLHLYMFFAGWTRIPLLGRLVRYVIDAYADNMHRAFLLSPQEARELVAIAGSVAAGPCDCRSVFKNCDNPTDNEILLGPTRHILMEAMPEKSREITVAEAEKTLEDSHKRGLIHTIIKCRGDFYAICNCCSCCCVPLRLSKQYGIGKVLVRHKDIIGEYRRYQESYHHEEDH
jgi:hypothetical protein